MKGYVAPLAAIPAVCSLIGTSLLFGMLGMRSLGFALVGAIVSYIMAFIGVFVIGHIINALAPTFGGQKNESKAMKVAVYSFTAAWVAGVFSLIPLLGIIGMLLGLYSFYLMYVGLPILMKSPEDKAIGYVAVTFVATLVVYILIGAVVGTVATIGRPAMSFSGLGGNSSTVSIDPDSKLGKLEAMAKRMEEQGKKVEAAQKSGNQDEAAKAAMSMLGVAMGGSGKAVDPLAIDQLKPFVPETFAGLAKKSSKAEKSGAMGITVSKAEARYGDDSGKSVELEVTDTGGASGWMMFAGWAMVQGEKEDQYGSEKTSKVNGRLVNEKSRKDGGGEYNIVLGERFVVTAKGRGVDLNTLKTAVASLDLAKLEGMKDVGVQK